MQLIYDFDGTSGTIGFICADIDQVPSEVKASLRKIGIKIPNDQR